MKRGFFEPTSRTRYAPEIPRALRSRTNRKESVAPADEATTNIQEPSSEAVEVIDLNPLRRVRRGAGKAKVRTAIRAVKKYRRLSSTLPYLFYGTFSNSAVSGLVQVFEACEKK